MLSFLLCLHDMTVKVGWKIHVGKHCNSPSMQCLADIFVFEFSSALFSDIVKVIYQQIM